MAIFHRASSLLTVLRRKNASAPPPFTPDQITPQLFYVLSTDVNGDGTQPTSGASIGTWVNKFTEPPQRVTSNNNVRVTSSGDIRIVSSVSIDAVQTTPSSQPIFTTNILNGNPVIRFDGVDDAMTAQINIDYTVCPSVTLIILYQVRSGGGTDQALMGQDNLGYDRFIKVADPGVGADVSTGYSLEPVPALGILDSWRLATIQFQNGVTDGSKVWVNGNLEATFLENHDNSGLPYIYLGTIGEGSGNLSAKIDMAAMIIYPRVLTDNERTSVENYLNTLYGLP